MAVPSMDALSDKYAEKGVGSVFLYTHEAHPAENYPPLRSMEQKLRHAHDIHHVLGSRRIVVVDALDGACHRAYGSMPNMTWIFTRAGMPIYKAPWTDAESVANAIAYYVEVAERRRAGERLIPVSVQRLDYRTSDQEGFYAGLARNGPRAVTEFRKANF